MLLSLLHTMLQVELRRLGLDGMFIYAEDHTEYTKKVSVLVTEFNHFTKHTKSHCCSMLTMNE